jgi:hypothetical protein
MQTLSVDALGRKLPEGVRLEEIGQQTLDRLRRDRPKLAVKV